MKGRLRMFFPRHPTEGVTLGQCSNAIWRTSHNAPGYVQRHRFVHQACNSTMLNLESIVLFIVMLNRVSISCTRLFVCRLLVARQLC